MSYPDLFKRAALLWWRTRSLWPLGVLAALMGTGDYSAGNFNSGVNLSTNTGGTGDVSPELLEQWGRNPALLALVENPAPFLIGLAVVIVLWTLIASLIGQLAHGAMIRVADVADQGYQASIGDGLRVGAARLLPMFLLNLLLALPVLIMLVAFFVVIGALVAQLVAAGAGAFETPESGLLAFGGLLFCLVPLVLGMIAVSLALSFFTRIAQRACVLEGRGAVASLRRSWRLVTRNFGNVLLNWIALLMLGAVFGIVATLPALAIAIPAGLGFLRSGEIPWLTLLGLLLYGFVTSVLVGGVLSSFNSALWTVLFRTFVAREAVGEQPTPAVGGL